MMVSDERTAKIKETTISEKAAVSADDASLVKNTLNSSAKSAKHKITVKTDYVDWRSDCPNDLRSFLINMETILGRSPRTVTAYYVDLRLFCRYLKYSHGLTHGIEFDQIQIADTPESLIRNVTLTETLEFFSFLMHERENAASTRARKVSALHSFYKFLEVSGIVRESPVKNLQLPKIPKKLPKHLSLEESKTLLASTASVPTSKRDFCIFILFLNCGMRLTELVSIDISDLQTDRLQITGKGNKQRLVYLNDACQEAIRDYLPERRAVSGAKDNSALFLSKRKSRITPRGVENILERYLTALGLKDKGYSVHKLRHTAATLMYQYGHVDIRVLQMILGHENLGTTQIYTHVSNTQMEDAFSKSPLADLKPPKPSRKADTVTSAEVKTETSDGN